MRLNKKKVGNSPITSWDEMTVREYLLMKEIGGLQLASPEEKNLRVAALIARIDYDEFELLPLADVREYVDACAFLYEKPKPVKAKRKYRINGRTYVLFKEPSEMSVAQYIDFDQIQREGFDRMPGEMLSIFLVPEGHEYNDGYDRERQLEDMLDMGITEALGVCDFFIRRLSILMSSVLTALKIKMKWMVLTAPKEDREMMRRLEKEMSGYMEETLRTYGSGLLRL